MALIYRQSFLGPTGGYDNLANWPDASNRPVYSVGSNTLRWIGPIGGGASTSSDVAQSQILTPVAGSFSTSSNNQVITYQNFAGEVHIVHTGVTFQGCVFNGGTSFTVVSVENTGAVIEDCVVAPSTQKFDGISRDGTAVVDGALIRRCNLYGMENCINNSVRNTTIIDCWFNKLNDGIGSPHIDGIEFYGGSTNSAVTHCTFDGTLGAFSPTSGVNLTNADLGQGTSVTNIAISNTRFINFPGNAINDDNGQSAGTVTFSCVNCMFFNNLSYRRDSVTCSPNSGNYNGATADATSGTLTNGTGAI